MLSALQTADKSTAQVSNPETGRYYYRARYYDPQAGRFLSEDPIGFNGGQNFYEYVYNDPADYSDPLGLRKYKCNALGMCSKLPFGPKPNRPTPLPPPKPCPLIKKAFDEFDTCYDKTIGEKIPGLAFGQPLKKVHQGSVPAPGSSGMPEFPSFGIGDVIDVYGGASQEALKDCFNEYPLAALDPRFTVFDVGRLSAPKWWEKALEFFEVMPPIK